MAYNSNTGIVYADSSSGVSVNDVQQALGRTANDVGRLCSDMEWSGQSLVRANKTNPMAKYKPVRHPSLAVLTPAQRASTRYGFGGGLPPTLDLTQNNVPQNDWVYLPPRGKGGGSGGADEWYRLLDFDGYASLACAPLVVSVGQLVYDAGAESQILLFGNGKSNAIREDGGRWVEDQSLSITELLQSAESLYDYHVSFLLVDTTDANKPKNMLVTRITMDRFVGPEYSSFIFPVYAQGQEVSGITYPAVPLLASSRSGHDFAVVACLLPAYPPEGYGYSVYTPTTSPAVSTLIPYSLGFSSGCDRAVATLASGAFKLDGMRITSVSVTYADMVTEVTYQGFVYRAFRISVSVVLDTSDASGWYGDDKTVSGTISVSNGGGFPFGPSPSEGDNPISAGVATKVASQTSGQVKNIFTTDSDLFLWVMKNQGVLLPDTVTATVTLDYPLDTPVTGQGSVSIQ